MNPFDRGRSFLDAYRVGDASALADVYRSFEPVLRRFLTRGFVFNSAGRSLHYRGALSAYDVDDMIQESFKRAFSARARFSYDGLRPFKNYLFTIARNVVITMAATNRRHVLVGDALDASIDPRSSSSTGSSVMNSRAAAEGASTLLDRIENFEIHTLVASFLERRTEEERAFFRIRFLEPLSQEATAKSLGWNRARVRKIEKLLRSAFVEHMAGSGYLRGRSAEQRPAHPSAAMLRARALWRSHRVEHSADFTCEAA